VAEPVDTPAAAAPVTSPDPAPELKPVTAAQLRDAWPEVLEAVQKSAGRLSWAVVSTTTVQAFEGDVLTLGFPNESDVAGFRPTPGAAPGESVSEQLRAAILEVLGVRVKFLPRVEAAAAPPPREAEAPPEPEPEPEPGGWNVTEIPVAEPTDSAEPEPPAGPEVASAAPANARYGEAVVRELLNANFLEEQSLAPRDRPVTLPEDQ
jgi:DNA polymerase III subunit gamma/tau